jgi:diaminohydroxyphosphoribosylaminopyrimidine deaminase/5-amino-6-(5-phosphoribosylamino)uracil reductase
MEKFMKRALVLALKADPFPNPRVGAVLVRDNKIIGEGYHRKPGKPHAEIEALKDAKARREDVEGAVLFVSLEPCSHTNKRTPPCTDAIISNQIKKVVFGMSDPNPLVSSRKVLQGAGIEVVGPVAVKQAMKINKRYLGNIRSKPFIAIKMAMSVDGKTATREGDSKWISCEKSRRRVLEMRSGFDAVLVGAETVKQDNPRLTARTKERKDPYRIIVDSDMCIPESSKILKNKDQKTIIATTRKAAIKKNQNVLICGEDRVDLKTLFLGLNAMGITRILIEGGSEINASALETGMVDKLFLFISPKIIGGREAKGVFGGKGIGKMKNAIKIKRMKNRRVDQDLLLECDLL